MPIRARARKPLLVLLLIGLVAAVAGVATRAALSDTTANTGSSAETGTLDLSNSAASLPLFSPAAGTPDDVTTSCVTVAATGTTASDVRLFLRPDGPVGSLADHVDVQVEPGTFSGPVPAYPACTGFAPAPGATPLTGTLADLAAARSDHASGWPTSPLGHPDWRQNDRVVYRISTSMDDATPDSEQGAETGQTSLVWSARTQ